MIFHDIPGYMIRTPPPQGRPSSIVESGIGIANGCSARKDAWHSPSLYTYLLSEADGVEEDVLESEEAGLPSPDGFSSVCEPAPERAPPEGER